MNPNRFDRRRFLRAGGATLALPMLEAFVPRLAFGQTASAPTRLLIVHHNHGRLMGDATTNDAWSPARTTGPLPMGAAPSAMLAPLQAIRDEVVTLDGVDNLVRHCIANADGHGPAEQSALTCRALVNGKVAYPTFDYVMGLRLRANASMRASVIVPGTAADATWRLGNSSLFYGANGAAPTIIDPDPGRAIADLFGMTMAAPPPPTQTPTLQQRMTSLRPSVLDSVLASFNALRGKVNAADRARLDSHADFIRGLEQAATPAPDGGTGGVTAPSQQCHPPSASSVPSNSNGSGGVYLRGEKDGVMVPAIIENVAQALACDTIRVASLFFWESDDPVFPTQFSGTSPFQGTNWHTVIHGVPRISDSPGDAANLQKSFGLYASTFTQLVQRLAQLTDVDGSRVLDNTLVLWVSEMGYGSVHSDHDLPVVMAGLKRAFPKGQGRHVVCNRRSMGDLLAQVMRMFGGTDQTFGDTGTIGDHNSGSLTADAGFPGYITQSTPLHSGPIDL